MQLSFDRKVQNKTSVDIGVPQGLPISSILFLIYTKNIWQDKGLQLSYINDYSIAASSISAMKNCKAFEKMANMLLNKAKKQGIRSTSSANKDEENKV